MKNKDYKQPRIDIFELKEMNPLLAGSGYPSNGGRDNYGDEITDEWED